jgi:cobalt-zinc-cadmium efflux system outer membrane protein
MKLLNWNLTLLAAAAMFCDGQTTAGPAPERSSASPPAPSPAVTIDSLVAEVLASNPELNFYRAEVAVARGERRVAAAWANPELSAQAGQKRVRAGGLSDEGTAWAVSVQQTFEWPGRMPLRKAIANHQVQLAELGLGQFRAALSARTRALAYNLAAAQEKTAAAQEVADRFQELREVLLQRDPAGLTPLLETRIIEATELTLKRKASEAETAAQAATLELHQLRGAAWTNAVRIASVRLGFNTAPDTDSLLAACRTNNFELRMRQAELEQQGFKVALARKEGYPAFTVGPYFAQERAGDREQQIGLALSLPLPLWNRNRGGVESAEARRQQAETSLLVTQRNIERQVVENAQGYDTKRREMARWRSDSVDEFRKAAELADRHYRLGAVPISTYVELQKQYLEAVEALLDTKREALDAAQALEHLTGLPLSLVNAVGKETPP